jgi:uncharacterized protein (DUF433 family)
MSAPPPQLAGRALANTRSHALLRRELSAPPAMMLRVGEVIDLLDRAVYSFGQIDNILRLANGTAGRWIDGYQRRGRDYPPVVRERQTGRDIATWGEFVECRLLSEFRSHGVRMQRLRPAVDRLREMTGAKYPLASAKLWLSTDGRDLLMRVQDDVNLDQDLRFVVRDGQMLLPTWTKPSQNFARSLQWSSSSDDAVPVRVLPDPGNPLIEIDPERGFGDPVVAGRGIQTSVIAELVKAGEAVEQIAEDYELSSAQVQAAVRYELQRASA